MSDECVIVVLNVSLNVILNLSLSVVWCRFVLRLVVSLLLCVSLSNVVLICCSGMNVY